MSITSHDRAKLYEAPPRSVLPLVLWVLRLAALVAAAASGYLVWIAFSGAGVAGCSGGLDCDEVLSSRWSTWFGLPVSLPALSLYVSLLCVLAFAGPLSPERVRRTAWTVALALCLLAGAAAIWFIGLQVFVLDAYCSRCLTVHVCGLGAAALALVAARQGVAKFRGALAVAVSGIAILIVGQTLGPQTESPQLERVATSDKPPTTPGDTPRKVTAQRLTLDDLYADIAPATNAAASRIEQPEPVSPTSSGNPSSASLDDLTLTPSEPTRPTTPAVEVRTTAKAPQRVVSLFRGAAQVDVYQHPVLGSPEARYVIVKLFDYTCPHCRAMHEHLQKSRDEFHGDLAVVMCPAPLNPQCNPQMPLENPKHAEACDLARLALAVWQADPTKFAEFDAWLFAPPKPPSAAEARVKAIELVGETRLNEELFSDELRQRLAIGPKLYALVGGGILPKLLLPTGMLVGPGDSTEAVMQELRKEFATP